MSITEAYLQNIIVPRTKADDVCRALCEWHATQGYEQAAGRRLFDYRDFHNEEKRAFVLSNEKWCVVLHSSEMENGTKLHRAFAHFPAVVELWAQDGAWGYRLREHGNQITAYCSKAVEDLPDEPQARQSSESQRLVAACDAPHALDRLRRLEKRRHLFVQKACAEFADALEAPLALANFYDADQMNAGMAEERHALGWNCQMLAFTRVPGAPADPVPKLWPDNLTAEQRKEIITQYENERKQSHWSRKLLVLAGGLLFAIRLVGELILAMGLWGLTMIPCLRPLFLGKATLFCDQFWKELKPVEPERVQIRGESALNTRHNCSILALPPIQVLPKFQSRKPIPGREPVFDIKLDKFFISCMAYPTGRVPRIAGCEILEERTFSTDIHTAGFVKRVAGKGEHQYFLYEWTVNTAQAAYKFTSSPKEEISSRQLKLLENMIRSFRIVASQVE